MNVVNVMAYFADAEHVFAEQFGGDSKSQKHCLYILRHGGISISSDFIIFSPKGKLTNMKTKRL